MQHDHLPAINPGFARNFAFAIAIGAFSAALLAPFVAFLLASAGFRFPFPRICDRVAMVTIGAALVLFAERLQLVALLHTGFGRPLSNWPSLLKGLGTGMTVIVILSGLALVATHQTPLLAALTVKAITVLPAAFLIAVLEEAFFRAILLGGLSRNSHRAPLITSAVIYAAAHLVHGPKHFYVSGFHPLAGFADLTASLTQLVFPGDLFAMACGLFLLGLVLGQAFLGTGRVHFAIGLHAAFVVGAKCWPIVVGSALIPRWLAGPGPVPLIAAPAGWVAALLLLGLTRARFFRTFAPAPETTI